MKVYTCNTFRGHYPIGSAAVVVADSAQLAAAQLETELNTMGLDQRVTEWQMIELMCDQPTVRVLVDGNY